MAISVAPITSPVGGTDVDLGLAAVALARDAQDDGRGITEIDRGELEPVLVLDATDAEGGDLGSMDLIGHPGFNLARAQHHGRLPGDGADGRSTTVGVAGRQGTGGGLVIRWCADLAADAACHAR
jgi:hypothetical protein